MNAHIRSVVHPRVDRNCTWLLTGNRIAWVRCQLFRAILAYLDTYSEEQAIKMSTVLYFVGPLLPLKRGPCVRMPTQLRHFVGRHILICTNQVEI